MPREISYLPTINPDYKTILGEGRSKTAREGFYMAQRGLGEVLIIAESLLDAKHLARQEPDATLILARTEEHKDLQSYLSAQELKPTKVIVLANNQDRDTQMRIAASCQSFHNHGASLALMNVRFRGVTEQLTHSLKP